MTDDSKPDPQRTLAAFIHILGILAGGIQPLIRLLTEYVISMSEADTSELEEMGKQSHRDSIELAKVILTSLIEAEVSGPPPSMN